MARVQAACKLIDLLPSELLRTRGVLPCGHHDLANAIDGCPKTVKTKEPDDPCPLMSRPRIRRLLDNGICFDVNVMVRAGLRTGTCKIHVNTQEVAADLLVDDRNQCQAAPSTPRLRSDDWIDGCGEALRRAAVVLALPDDRQSMLGPL